MKGIYKHISFFVTGVFLFLSATAFNNNTSLPKEDVNEINVHVESPYFSKSNIKDGPYFFLEDNHVTVKWIYKNRPVERHIYGKNFNVVKRKFGFEFNYDWIQQDLTTEPDFVQRYSNVDKIIALSDVHGQYDVLVRLLKRFEVIDDHFNWTYGNGHLVVLGDIMDRGDKVTESLWLIYRLEKQAETVGGKVHFLLGNHEIMVLNSDARYIHEKYLTTARLFETTYDKLYSESNLIGNWLRKKPVMVTINDMLFVHAGVSEDFVLNNFTRSGTNKLFTENIVGNSWKEILTNQTLSFLMGNKGPVWYRGYFEDTTLTEEKINTILNYFEINHIIVGHTSMPNIVTLFGDKIYGIDSSIKLGDYGEVFIYENNTYYRGTISGTRIEL